MTSESYHWQTSDSLKIYAQKWLPEGEVKGVISLVHGLGEHCQRYEHLAVFFTNHGYIVNAYDRRGHGQSEGKKGHTISYQAFIDEIVQLVSESDKMAEGLPHFLYGHSMGGNLTLYYGLMERAKLNGVIVTGPWIKLAFEPPSFEITLGKLMNKIWPAYTQGNKLNPDDLAKDTEVGKVYVADPLVHNKISAATGMSMFDACDELLEKAAAFKYPLLMMHGAEDPITSPLGTKEFYNKLHGSGGDVSLKIWNTLKHEIHNEKEQNQIFEHTLDWMKSKV